VTPGGAVAAESLAVATYNVHRCIGRDGKCDPARIARVVRELDADLVGLQEIDSSEDRPGHAYDQLAAVASEAGYDAVPGPTLVHQTAAFGNALLTRRPVAGIHRFEIGIPGREPRAVLDVELRCTAGPVRAIVTHFGLLGRERRLQAEMLARILGERVVDPTVVLGDFNEWMPRGRALRSLSLELGASAALRTFPSFCPLLALDRIWVRPPRALISITVHRSPLAAIASDHLPVRAVVRVPSRRAAAPFSGGARLA
jgi:endonuclease/exonuclease/phosphatase family metal-dependent hydrolase